MYRSIFAIALMAIAWSGHASAMGTCDGTYAAFLLHALPQRPVVRLDVRNTAPANQRLADRFLAGMREAGVSTGANPDVTLHVTTSVSIDNAGGSNRRPERRAAGLSALQSGNLPSRQVMPRGRLRTPSQARSAPLLELDVDAIRRTETRVSWRVSVHCRPTGTDRGQLAQDLGLVVGRALGRRIERRGL